MSPKGFSEQEREMIRARLLEHGRVAFTAYGLKKTNVEELASAAGISKGAFYLFFDSKEALFMEVMEEEERKFRETILAAVTRPASSPRERMKSVLQLAFSIWKTTPILQMVTTQEYALLMMKLPPERIQEHLSGDEQFVQGFYRLLGEHGVKITVEPHQFAGLMNALFFVSLHENDFGEVAYPGTIDLLLDMVASYCVAA